MKKINQKDSDKTFIVPNMMQIKADEGQPDLLYLKYSPEQLEEVIADLESLIQYLKYQESLSAAYRKEQIGVLKHLLRNKPISNLVYLQKGEDCVLKWRHEECNTKG